MSTYMPDNARATVPSLGIQVAPRAGSYHHRVPHPVPKPLRHPGTAHHDRIRTALTRSSSMHVFLQPGLRLVDAVERAVGDTESNSAQLELSGGVLDRISHCIPDCSSDGSTAMSYSATRESAAPAQLLGASASFGYRDGQRFLHCHAAWLDNNGVLRAGHLWPETRLGAVPVHAVVHSLPGVELRNEFDSETHLPAFSPHVVTRNAGQPSGRRAVVCRVLPGEDIGSAIEAVCAEHDFERATVRASLGSFVGAWLRRDDGSVVVVDGPATEVVSLVGTVDRSRHGGLTLSLIHIYEPTRQRN